MIFQLVDCSKQNDILSLAEIQARAADGGTAEQLRKGEWCGEEQVGNNGEQLVNSGW